ncbi:MULTISPECIES: Gfo/Idh/MocA family protein [Microbacteriaceae]|uniref:Gfo/Idh/MocA family protein n=1 Tax=Microbacteriaceae TaxID=85023 RepID=UPI0010D62EB2|nr:MULTISPECIES: Gfo/Idh/MocA family oxidoreductase [Microbacteriaceae]TDQ02641.1 putative dehydrogenase [Leifsonia sp. 115AMFTsu3.1]
MQTYSAVVVAAGGQGRVHAAAYQADERVRLVGVADVDSGAADRLATELGIPRSYSDVSAMLREERPDIVSVCTPPAFRRAVVDAAIDAGVRAIHCEKPFALSYGDAVTMTERAADAGVQLTVNLQRRFEPVHRFARAQLDDGAIGELVSIEGYCPNLFDWGSHIVDLALFYRHDEPAEWVLGQIDVSTNRYVYGAFVETSSLTQVAWSDGVRATIATGREPATPILNRENNLGLILQGSRGRIVVNGQECIVQRFGVDGMRFASPYASDPSTWDHGIDPAIFACTREAVADLVDGLQTGEEPVLAARHALAGAAIVFATYESSRSRGRVGLPLQVYDNALLSGLDKGLWSPVGELRSTW